MDIQKIRNDLKKEKKKLSFDDFVSLTNEIKTILHEEGMFLTEPVDCVLWVKNEIVHANDYNPNSVAPPEMELLRVSINNDGYTQPVVTMPDDENYEVVDGFHRTRVCKECQDIKDRVNGYLPVVSIRNEQCDKADRMASTIRHNRARGKHKVDAMSDIVLDLKRRNWSDKKISKNLGMDEDEILRLTQISGLAEMFADRDFSKSWEPEGFEDSFEVIDG